MIECVWLQRNGRHGLTIVARRRARDLFMKSFWLRCWGCEGAWGPYPNKGVAEMMIHVMDILPSEADG